MGAFHYTNRAGGIVTTKNDKHNGTALQITGNAHHIIVKQQVVTGGELQESVPVNGAVFSAFVVKRNCYRLSLGQRTKMGTPRTMTATVPAQTAGNVLRCFR